VFNLVVFGGSQGAQFFGQTIPQAISKLSEGSQKRLKLTLQAREEDLEQAQAECAKMNIKADISPFFDNMAARIADAQLVISRSGASTVSELAAIGRPAILVPYPFALDHDQAANAAGMVEKGGAEVVAQSELSADKLAEMIENRMNNPIEAEKMAANGYGTSIAGRPIALSANQHFQCKLKNLNANWIFYYLSAIISAQSLQNMA
jgi:UDP-N-acetylglucosamine--N-acetylmuramyl-(pentapeptide) pyrophosphoryl-undecaprenol N-acetylglucosamine transferase